MNEFISNSGTLINPDSVYDQERFINILQIILQKKTQKELSEQTGLNNATISRMLNGARSGRPYKSTIDKIAKAIDDPELIQELYDATGYSSKKIQERKKIIADNGFSLDLSTVQVHEKFFSTLMRGLSMMTSLHKVEWTIKSGTPRSYDYLIELKEGTIDYWYIRYVDRITSDEERKKALTAIYGEFAKLKLDGKIKVSCATPSYEDYDYFITIPPYQLNTNASIIHFDFDLVFMVMDPGYNEANRKIIEGNAAKLEIPVTIFETDIFESVLHVEKSPCYLCARMRRGHLYNKAKELGCNKIALGHHYDDVIETILMGMLYGAQVQTMMPKLHSTNFEGMELIRPMYLIREDDIKAWRDYNDLYFIQCACKFTETCTTCGENGANPSKRQEVKKLIRELKQTNPFVEGNIFKSVENVNLSTVIAYKDGNGKHSFLDTYDKVDDK